MSASANDKLIKLSRRWVSQIGSGGVADGIVTTIPLSSTTNLPTDTAVIAVIDRVDVNGTATPELEETVVGVVSSTSLINCTRGVEGTAQAHSAGAVVEILFTAAGWNKMVDWGLVEHSQLGVHDKTKVVDLTTAQTLTNKTLTSPKINEDVALTATATQLNAVSGLTKATAIENVTGTDDAKFLTALANVPAFNNSLSRQAIINGNFDVWQRGTSVAMTAANAYAADRWYCETATAGTDKTVSREDGTGVNGSYYCARVKMVGDVDELLTFSQALESQDSIKFRGKKVTLSFYARGGAEFVADNATLVSKIVTGKGTDQKVLAFTTSADGVSQNNTLTTGWQKFTCTTTAAIAADITQIGVSFAFTHAGSGTTTNYFEIAQVQLCAGDVALPFMPKSFEEELRACQRYCYVPILDENNTHLALGTAVSTTVARIPLSLPATMRTTPALSVTANQYLLFDGVTTVALTALANLSFGEFTGNCLTLSATVASGLTQFRPYLLITDASPPRSLILEAEL